MSKENKRVPEQPLKVSGKLWHVGWDIPTQYAVDAKDQCWMDDAHGGTMRPVTAKRLLSACENKFDDEQTIRKALGLKPRLPEWARIAVSEGWTPPESFDVKIYDA